MKSGFSNPLLLCATFAIFSCAYLFINKMILHVETNFIDNPILFIPNEILNKPKDPVDTDVVDQYLEENFPGEEFVDVDLNKKEEDQHYACLIKDRLKEIDKELALEKPIEVLDVKSKRNYEDMISDFNESIDTIFNEDNCPFLEHEYPLAIKI